MATYLQINSQYKIAYKFFKRRKKTVIFLHGLLSDMNGAKFYTFQIFVKKNYSYLCFDFRGHGKSSGNFVNFGIGHWYQDLLNLIKALDIKTLL